MIAYLFFSDRKENILFLLLFYYSCPNFSPFALLCPAYSPSHSQSPHCCPCPWVIHTCSLTSSFLFFPPLCPFRFPSDHCQCVPCFYASGSILLVRLFCWLDSTYKWDHMVFVFTDWLISLSIIVSSSIHLVTKGRSPSLFLLCIVPLCKCTTVFLSTHLLMGT